MPGRLLTRVSKPFLKRGAQAAEERHPLAEEIGLALLAGNVALDDAGVIVWSMGVL